MSGGHWNYCHLSGDFSQAIEDLNNHEHPAYKQLALDIQRVLHNLYWADLAFSDDTSDEHSIRHFK